MDTDRRLSLPRELYTGLGYGSPGVERDRQELRIMCYELKHYHPNLYAGRWLAIAVRWKISKSLYLTSSCVGYRMKDD